MSYHRILIFGVTGSGKTTLAKKLSKKLRIPSYTTDDLIYRKNWNNKYPEKKRDENLKKISKKKNWIIEGTHREDWVIPAVKKADLVIIFDFPKNKLFRNLLKRQLEQITRKEIPKRKTSLKQFFALLKWAHQFKKKNLEIYKNLVKDHKKEFIIVRSRSEFNKLLEKIK